MVNDAYPIDIDPNRPSMARVYDALLGGSHHFASDRAVAERAVELVPLLPKVMRANRAFLHRAVRFAVSRGIRQFLDLGSGIPTEGNVHEVVRDLVPGGRVAYVDLDPSAVLHARAIIGDDPDTVMIHGDLQRPEQILADPLLREVIDIAAPVCVLMIAVLHFVPDSAELTAAMRHYHAAVAPDSLLAVTHATGGPRPEEVERVSDLYNRTGTPMVLRQPQRLRELLEGWEPVEPGLVYGPEWRPEPSDEWEGEPADSMMLAAVAVKP
ncbi:SAM-dependent methyltransferase [Actinoplanes sp. NPDC051346]|uniref:SAM-dependent methyltransferase n=1 Tax=Actinoplanes sp. NPDC051346 TaxID=3155048 RepID=UPI0034348965